MAEVEAALPLIFDSPRRLDFLLTDSLTQAVEGGLRLERMAKNKLEPLVEKAAGPEFLAEVQFTQIELAKAVGLTGTPAPAPEDAKVSAAMSALARAILSCAAKVIGAGDDDDPATLAAARTALRPIDELRDMSAKRHTAPEPKPA